MSMNGWQWQDQADEWDRESVYAVGYRAVLRATMRGFREGLAFSWLSRRPEGVEERVAGAGQ